MAKQQITLLTDDLDGSEAEKSLTFGFDGYLYEIDLSGPNAKEFEDFMSRYVAAGTRTSRVSLTGGVYTAGRRSPLSGASNPSFTANRDLNQAIRRWATQSGYELAERGRIPQHIVDAYHKGVPSVPPKAKDQPPLFEDEETDEPEVAPEPVKAVAKKATPRKTTTRSRAKA